MKQNTYRKNLLIPFLKILLDALAILSAFSISYYARFYSPVAQVFPVTKGFPPFINYLAAAVVLTAIYLVILSASHSYRSRYFSTFAQDIPVILRTCFIGILVAMSGAFLYRGFSYSRLTFFLMFFHTNLFLLAGRYLFHRIRRILMRKGFGIQQAVIIGSSAHIPRFSAQIQNDLHQNFRISGYLGDEKLAGMDVPYLGLPEQLSQLVSEKPIDAILMMFDADSHSRILNVIRQMEGKNVELFYIPDILDMITSHRGTFEMAGMPVLRLKAVEFSGWQGFLKRSFDLLVSVTGLIILAPLLFLLAVLIKINSRGPVFYKQKRIGLDGKEFTMLKFRSMVVDAEKESGPVWAAEKDPRTTSIGRFLRRSSLDELPQLINVIRGEMSMVGPRPERKVFVEQFRKLVPQYAERHRVKSGVTGWAQVNGLRGQSPIEDRTRYDVYYIENWCLWFDIKIILLTFLAIIRGKNAY
jgi:exopolysaccharide biosynthesis polyprenyl glycosylphosphotransferase